MCFIWRINNRSLFFRILFVLIIFIFGQIHLKKTRNEEEEEERKKERNASIDNDNNSERLLYLIIFSLRTKT